MNSDLSEDEMRQALFGEGSLSGQPETENVLSTLATEPSRRIASKIRVTLHVTNEFEGDYREVIFDSPGLSVLAAELDAKKKYKKYRYVTVVSVDRVMT